MRCYWKPLLQITVLFCFLVILYIFINSKQSVVELGSRQLYSDQYLNLFHNPQNVSYSILAGFPQQSQKYLTVGLSSIKRKNGFYLLDTLHSIFSQSSEEELQELVVVVLLSDFNMEWIIQVLEQITARFSFHVLRGHLIVIHVPQKYYPPLEGLKRNFNDAPDRVYFRSKQNVDYAFLLSFSANLSQFYIMLEDDISCSKNFLTTVKKFILSQNNNNWVTLEFSKLGYIGKLYHSSDLSQLVYFLFLFYQEMPCDWLMTHFSKLLTQDKVIRFRPSLFQHMGLYSSFQGSINRLKDDDFEEDPKNIGNNPPADVLTDIAIFDEYKPENAYNSGIKYFWGKSPSAGSHFTVILHRPAGLTRVLIQTGSLEREEDIFISAEVEVGHSLMWTEKGPHCLTYIKLGVFVNGQFERKNIEEGNSLALSCLRISVTKSQQEWVIIRRIRIWIKD